jgi:hypothetical protein
MPGYADAELERIRRCAWCIICDHIANSGTLDVRDAMPEPLRDLWLRLGGSP